MLEGRQGREDRDDAEERWGAPKFYMSKLGHEGQRDLATWGLLDYFPTDTEPGLVDN